MPNSPKLWSKIISYFLNGLVRLNDCWLSYTDMWYLLSPTLSARFEKESFHAPADTSPSKIFLISTLDKWIWKLIWLTVAREAHIHFEKTNFHSYAFSHQFRICIYCLVRLPGDDQDGRARWKEGQRVRGHGKNRWRVFCMLSLNDHVTCEYICGRKISSIN